jgi:hypothetical protein
VEESICSFALEEKSSSESTMKVTGPSFTEATFIMAAKGRRSGRKLQDE